MKPQACLFLLVAVLLITVSTSWKHGKPEPNTDNPERSQSATEMLNRLFGAARERAQAAREQQSSWEKQGKAYTPSNADMFAGLMDYAKDKWQNPPLLQVERNLILLERNTRLLAQEMATVRMLLDTLIQVTDDEHQTDALAIIKNTTLVPVQGRKYTIIEPFN